MAKCSSNKKEYGTQTIAEEALIHAHATLDFPAGGGPIAIYKCDECGNYHFTSQGPMNAVLAEYLKGNKVNRDKEAERWLRKLKDR